MNSFIRLLRYAKPYKGRLAWAVLAMVIYAVASALVIYLIKPILFDEVLAKVRRLLNYRELHLENQWLRRELNRAAEQTIVGHSPPMKRLFEMIRKVAPTPERFPRRPGMAVKRPLG